MMLSSSTNSLCVIKFIKFTLIIFFQLKLLIKQNEFESNAEGFVQIYNKIHYDSFLKKTKLFYIKVSKKEI
jgi:hypothetical protein